MEDAVPFAAPAPLTLSPTARPRAAVREPILPLGSWCAFGEFARLEALSCVFPIAVFAGLALTRLLPLPAWLPRYDFLLLYCLLTQWAMFRAGLETRDEVKVICVFHALGLGLELFKTHVGSWSYPGFAYTKVAGAPLYSGFMHASVASYLCQAWRRFCLELFDAPPARVSMPLAAAIYANFFTHHHPLIPDLRWPLVALVFAAYRRTTVRYEVLGRTYRMPLFLSFVLIGFFIYLAENLCTFFAAWQYPDQAAGWRPVHVSKFSSWFLLVILSFLLVAALRRVKERRIGATSAGPEGPGGGGG